MSRARQLSKLIGASNNTVVATPATFSNTVAVAASGITYGDASVQTTAPSGFGFKNRIINGAMVINQRGLTGPTSGYFVDRWQVGGVSATSLQTSGLPTGVAQAVSINRTVAGTAYITQNIESKNVTDLNGQTVTVSFYAKNVSGVGSITVSLAYANASDNFSGGVTSIQTVTASASPSSSWTYYIATFSALPSSVANGLQLNINAVIAASGTLEITGVQLEKGSTATSFDYRPYGFELALCQRYYETSDLVFYLPLVNSNGQMSAPFKVTKRANPTVTGSYSSTPSVVSPTVNGIIFTIYGNTLIQVNSWTASAEL